MAHMSFVAILLAFAVGPIAVYWTISKVHLTFAHYLERLKR